MARKRDEERRFNGRKYYLIGIYSVGRARTMAENIRSTGHGARTVKTGKKRAVYKSRSVLRPAKI